MNNLCCWPQTAHTLSAAQWVGSPPNCCHERHGPTANPATQKTGDHHHLEITLSKSPKPGGLVALTTGGPCRLTGKSPSRADEVLTCHSPLATESGGLRCVPRRRLSILSSRIFRCPAQKLWPLAPGRSRRRVTLHENLGQHFDGVATVSRFRRLNGP